MTAKRTILLVGVGSLLGRCILDALGGRRDNLTVVGADLDPRAPALAECDVARVLPPDDAPEFAAAVAEVCRRFDVDLVIPCRDPANAVLALAADEPSSPIRLAAPRGAVVAATRDKAASHDWCVALDIPHAPTLSTDGIDAKGRARIADWGFPLVAKPARGSGSLGVTVVQTPAQLAAVLATDGLVVQPFLSPPAALDLDLSRGLPLFWEVPCDDEPGVMALFGTQGEIGPHMCFSSRHRLGRNEALWVLDDPLLVAFAADVLPKFAAAGWRGPLNLQVRRGREGWQVIEINARFSGGTAARLHMGLDEVGWTLNTWLGEDTVPIGQGDSVARVARTFREVPVR